MSSVRCGGSGRVTQQTCTFRPLEVGSRTSQALMRANSSTTVQELVSAMENNGADVQIGVLKESLKPSPSVS
ncbi:MAG TPA: hypothetical protein VGP72_06790 [Planctomycetota bacterium]